MAARYNTISPAAALLLPPLALLESVALVSGFLLLLLAPLGPLTWPFAFVTRLSLSACDGLVNLIDGLPGAHWYVGQVPGWWLGIFYLGLLAVVILHSARARWRRSRYRRSRKSARASAAGTNSSIAADFNRCTGRDKYVPTKASRTACSDCAATLLCYWISNSDGLA